MWQNGANLKSLYVPRVVRLGGLGAPAHGHDPARVPLPLRVWLRETRREECKSGGRDWPEQNKIYPSTVLISHIIEYVLGARSSTSELNGPSEVAVKCTHQQNGCWLRRSCNCGGGHLRFTPLNPENSPGTWLTESDSSKPGTMVGVLWGPDSFLLVL